MAILEGRAPAKPAQTSAKPSSATDKGNFIVQIAAYTLEADADSRREKLKSQGITNAFVEPVTLNNVTNFRLRVGPFESRVAAQAAQTRLRTLGWGDGLILSK